jgi:hypothetical protein
VLPSEEDGAYSYKRFEKRLYKNNLAEMLTALEKKKYKNNLNKKT